MKTESATLTTLVRDYVNGQVPFWTFHNSFIEGFVRLPERTRGWEPLSQAYRLVLVSAPDPVAPADRASGVIGDAELKVRLAALLS